METVNVCESAKPLGVFPPKAIAIPVLRGQFWKNYKSSTTQHTLKWQEKGPRYGRRSGIRKLRIDDWTTIPLEKIGGPPLPSCVRRVQLGIVNDQQKLRGGHGGEWGKARVCRFGRIGGFVRFELSALTLIDSTSSKIHCCKYISRWVNDSCMVVASQRS